MWIHVYTNVYFPVVFLFPAFSDTQVQYFVILRSPVEHWQLYLFKVEINYFSLFIFMTYDFFRLADSLAFTMKFCFPLGTISCENVGLNNQSMCGN